MNDLYLTHIYERYKSLKESKKIIDFLESFKRHNFKSI